MAADSRIAVLFADIAGSTAIYDRLGDAKALSRIGACIAALKAHTLRCGGRVVKTAGDGLMCAFADSSAALRAASEMQLAQEALAQDLQLRIGFHVGRVIEAEQDLFGDTVNVAARVAGFAKPAQILTTESAVLVLPGYLRGGVRSIGEVSLRGRQQPIGLYEIVWQCNAELTMVDSDRAPPALAPRRLTLRCGGCSYRFPEGATQITLGRGEDNDIVVGFARASRLHGRIEARSGGFALVDLSTNGTYVRFEGAKEQLLRHEEIPLRGAGVIGCGQSTCGHAPELLEFRCD